jgi:superfamily II DNA/RNA helicase
VTVIDTTTPTASVASVLSTLTVARITELARDAGLAPHGRRKDEIVDSVAETGRIRFRALLAQLRRDELQAACREHRLPDTGRARQALMQRLLKSHGAHDSAPPPPLFSGTAPERKVPRAGDTILARHRQWLVDDVKLPPNEGDATWVALTCLDDDHRGQPLELLWELELGAKVIDPEAHGLGQADRLDPPRHFGAYLHALRWQSVTAADKNYFQSPFRAGIEILAHQLTPLQKALSLPRANLFIADDVGLGKTIEAGLVLQELLLRQRVEFTLIVAPASVTLQWQREMEQRFGLRFEIYSREFVLARRQERGFGINPWTTHTRFIISYPLLRRPEYRDPLLAHLATLSKTGSQASSRAKKSLLILDEAHTAAPSGGGRYAVDSQTTHVIRDIAPRFENRLFLSATPHNGHSNSFSALLEILDPQRFTRGVPVEGREQLREVMVRRLKRDLRQLTHSIRFPERKVVRIAIDMEPAEGNELQLASTLGEYTALFADLPKTKRLPLINLQKRLLSSVEAFARTLKVHSQTKRNAVDAVSGSSPDGSSRDEEADAEHTLGLDDDALDELEERRIASATADLHKVMPEGAAALLESMREQAEALRREPDEKARALMAWMREHLCPAIGDRDAEDSAWTDRRVLIFTEYGDTRRYLMGLLQEAVRHTDRGDDRILQIHGGMNEQVREEVQYAFNAEPKDDPVRILVATDAAREGLNLQAHCADLFHFDIPWNPSRMEQRNGRIDRALQPSKEVRCHYFVYEHRAEDKVLEKVVEKTEVISRELGSLGEVVRERIASALDPGIRDETEADVDKATDLGDHQTTAEAELEASREQKELQREMDRALRTYSQSQKRLNFRPEHLRDALNVGLSLFGADPLAEADGTYRLPDLPDHWQATLDALRPPRGREEAWHEWRDRPPRPVVFKAPRVLTQSKVHLHLEHPFVQRVFARFLTQGFGHHDLSRVTAVAMPDTGDTVALALGRLCLFGSGAGRLHDALIAVAARVEGTRLTLLDTRDSEAQFAALEKRLEQAPTLDAFAPALRDELVGKAQNWMLELRPALRQEADAMAVETELKLKARAKEEAEALTRILDDQRKAIEKTLGGKQLRLDFGTSEAEQRQAKQVDRDRRYLEQRLIAVDRELATEPDELAAIYDVKLRRFEPVGLVILYPELRLR